MRSVIRLAVAAVALTAAGPSFAATLHVPAEYPTIQAAVDAASPGDQVLVAPGTYRGAGNRDITFRGKNLTVRGEGGASATVLDCEASSGNSHRAFELHNLCAMVITPPLRDRTPVLIGDPCRSAMRRCASPLDMCQFRL